jgi:uncharacterized damage-inducible protein DinB
MTRELIHIFSRDLEKLKSEISSFRKEENLWKVEGAVNNSAGTLALHLIGNLNHFIGHILGNSGYVRDRQAEFNSKHLPVDELISGIEEVSEVVTQTLQNISDDELSKPYPEQVFGFEMTHSYMLIHLSTHLSYHLGQINYIRRIVDEN